MSGAAETQRVGRTAFFSSDPRFARAFSIRYKAHLSGVILFNPSPPVRHLHGLFHKLWTHQLLPRLQGFGTLGLLSFKPWLTPMGYAHQHCTPCLHVLLKGSGLCFSILGSNLCSATNQPLGFEQILLRTLVWR